MRAPVPALAFAFGLSAIGGSALADAAYCPDLKRLTDLAVTKEKFAYIAGPAREGNFRDTTLALGGWRDCSLYGARTYTCDSQSFGTSDDAERALATLVVDVKSCLGGGWIEDNSRSTPAYVVVQNAQDAASITLSTDAADEKGYVVRLILFLRGR